MIHIVCYFSVVAVRANRELSKPAPWWSAHCRWCLHFDDTIRKQRIFVVAYITGSSV